MSDNKSPVNVSTDMVMAVFILWFIFWMASGFERVDCAIGVARACAIIEGTY